MIYIYLNHLSTRKKSTILYHLNEKNNILFRKIKNRSHEKKHSPSWINMYNADGLF